IAFLVSSRELWCVIVVFVIGFVVVGSSVGTTEIELVTFSFYALKLSQDCLLTCSSHPVC
ncbi:hypothetical protein M9458_051986, partial [Cirrhinus mrigala]